MGKSDFFSDVQELKDNSLGVLGGEGAEFLEKVKTEIDRKGITSTCPCGQCGRPQQITVEWPEAVIGSLALLPPGWELDNQSRQIYANIGCGSCQYQLKLLFSPQELKRYVIAGVAEGQIPRGQVDQWAANPQLAAQAIGRH